MPTATAHVVGTFNWPELASTDTAAAKKFYSALFGWEAHDQPMGPDEMYTIFKLRGLDVASLFALQPLMLQNGVPPHWGTYITVDNADAATEKAKSLGGTVVMGPMDVMDHGRMSVITDPQGATFSVWQAIKHHGIQLVREPGALGWTQLNAKSAESAKAFYTALIGWQAHDSPMSDALGGGHYTTWLNAEGPAGGMMQMPSGTPAPSHWLPYFCVADVDAAHTQAAALGALTYVPPMDIPDTGRFAVIADPQGAAFAILTFSA